MKIFFSAVLVAIALIGASNAQVENCIQGLNCKREDGCVCLSSTSPIAINDTPQFVLITIDDSVTKASYDDIFTPIFEGRTNPDGNPITGTFFVPHEYTDYECVNKLYNAGHEIGTHSITKDYNSNYWVEASKDLLVSEFYGQKQIISKFANIPIEHIVGVRTPQFMIAGDTSFEAYLESELTYDSSWPTLSSRTLNGYTLDYASSQQCTVSVCPNETYPGFWVNPINNIKGVNETECNSLWGCSMVGNASDITDWLVNEFHKTYDGNRTPFKLLINSVWFNSFSGNQEAFDAFLDYLGELEDVFIVSESSYIDWMLSPEPVGNFTSPVEDRSASCTPVSCMLDKDGDIRYMMSCVPCPAVYPWLDNPFGEANNNNTQY